MTQQKFNPNPFALFEDPADVARAEAALRDAWSFVEESVPEHEREYRKRRMTYIVASCAVVGQADLAQRAIMRFLAAERTL